MPDVSIIIAVSSGSAEALARSLASALEQPGAPEVVLAGAPPAGVTWDPARVRVVEPPAGAGSGEALDAAVAAAGAPLVVVLEPGERLAADALSRHQGALESPSVVASYGRTAVDEGGRVRQRPDQGRGGAGVLGRLLQDRHLVASSACLAWRREAAGAAPFAGIDSPAGRRLALALRLARQGELVFHPATLAERTAAPGDVAEQEEVVRVVLGVLYGPQPLDEKTEHRARVRLARELVALGKHHHRQGDLRRAGKFFDEAVKAAPGYFRGRRYQFLNFVKNLLRG